jgi:hypothetical protein
MRHTWHILKKLPQTFLGNGLRKTKKLKIFSKGDGIRKRKANGLCHEEVHRFCCRGVTGFYGTRVHERWLAPTRKIQLSCTRSKKITHVQRHYVQYCTEFHVKQAISLEGTDRNAFTTLSKIWLVQGRFSQNSQSLNFCGHFLYRISSKSGEKCIKYEKNSIYTLK